MTPRRRRARPDEDGGGHATEDRHGAEDRDDDVRRRATEQEAKALASPLRLRILRACLHDARTNRQIASVLDRDPATTLHHVRRLVDTGFLAAQPARRGQRGAREVPYLATGKSWRVEAPGGSPIMLEAFVEEVGLVPAEQVHTVRMGLRLDADALGEFESRFVELLTEFRARPGAPDATAWSVFFAVHPDPNVP